MKQATSISLLNGPNRIIHGVQVWWRGWPKLLAPESRKNVLRLAEMWTAYPWNASRTREVPESKWTQCRNFCWFFHLEGRNEGLICDWYGSPNHDGRGKLYPENLSHGFKNVLCWCCKNAITLSLTNRLNYEKNLFRKMTSSVSVPCLNLLEIILAQVNFVTFWRSVMCWGFSFREVTTSIEF